MQPSIAAWPILLSSSGLKKIIAAFNDIECRLFKANTCRATSAIACSTLLNQSRLKLYHYTSRPRLRLGRGLDFYTRVEANDCTKHHRKQRRAQCVESSDHCRLASACVTFVQDVAWSLLSVSYIAIPDWRRAVGLVAYLILFLLMLYSCMVALKIFLQRVKRCQWRLLKSWWFHLPRMYEPR